MPPTVPNPALVECFKPKQPGEKLHASTEQLKAKEGKLIPWADKADWQAKKGKYAPVKAAGKKSEPKPEGTDAPPASDKPDPEDKAAVETHQKEREALLNQAEDLGVATTAAMTNAQIKAQIEKKKKSGK